ncbi:MAG TPA: L,D-transpeptidase [Actinoplanes sp.]|nr:L,D-transpeptidase [Actinoplanes sp.]
MSVIHRAVIGGALALAIGTAAVVAYAAREPDAMPTVRQVAAPASATSTAPPVPEAAPAAPGLPEISYRRAAPGLPRDRDIRSVEAVTEGLRPATRIALYDAPGGRARAWLPRSISGLQVTVPIVERRPGWLAVLVPSANRRLAWVPESSGEVRPLRDQLVVDLGERRLTWLRDGRRHDTWSVAVGSSRTPTPLGRTFVMGRTTTHGSVFAGLDALVLGSVPEDRDALPASLQGGHTAIHAWRDTSAFGRSVSNGCIRIPATAQRALLRGIPTGVVLTVTP